MTQININVPAPPDPPPAGVIPEMVGPFAAYDALSRTLSVSWRLTGNLGTWEPGTVQVLNRDGATIGLPAYQFAAVDTSVQPFVLGISDSVPSGYYKVRLIATIIATSEVVTRDSALFQVSRTSPSIQAASKQPVPSGTFVNSSSLPVPTREEIVEYLVTGFPRGWAAADVTLDVTEAPNLAALFKGLAEGTKTQTENTKALQDAIYLATARSAFIDLFAMDYFGSSMKRRANEMYASTDDEPAKATKDDLYRARIRRRMSIPKNTAEGFRLAVESVIPGAVLTSSTAADAIGLGGYATEDQIYGPLAYNTVGQITAGVTDDLLVINVTVTLPAGQSSLPADQWEALIDTLNDVKPIGTRLVITAVPAS